MATNTIELERTRTKPQQINETDRYSAAHNGLVAGSYRARLPRRSPSGEGGPRGTRATAWQATQSCKIVWPRQQHQGYDPQLAVVPAAR
jgi:hypothetical protein